MRSRLFGNKIKSTFLIALSLLLVLPTFLNLFLAPSASAASTSGSEFKKAAAAMLYKCYNAEIGKTLTIDNFNGDRLVSTTGVKLPNGYMDNANTCSKLITELLKSKGIAIPSTAVGEKNSTEIANFLKNSLGYESSGSAGTGECIYFRYVRDNEGGKGTPLSTQKLCATEIPDSGDISGKLKIVSDRSIDNIYFEIGGLFSDPNRVTVWYETRATNMRDYLECDETETNWQTLKSKLNQCVATKLSETNFPNTNIYYYMYTDGSFMVTESYGTTTEQFTITNNSADKAVAVLLGEQYTSSGQEFTENEKFTLYQNYLTEYYNVDVHCDLSQDEIYKYEGKGYQSVKFSQNGTVKTCWVKAQNNENGKVNGLSAFTYTPVDVGFNDIISAQNASTLQAVTSTSTSTDPGTGGGTDIPQTEATCHSTSGAMGWFICPVLEFAASASAWIYEYVIEPSLVIRSDLFRTDNSGGKGTFEAWGVFRDIANIIFAVLLLFVIFSQITGIGIDNYGIKKTLPNLIVAAILVNLSYIICQALVDVSNIAGGGLYGLISRITVNVPNTDVAGIGFSTSIIFTIAVAVGGLTATGIAVGGLGAFWSLVGGALLAVLPALIGALVAVVFLFFMLAMRQSMVVLLVVVSPLAFVCYTLPNTKNLFNRWAQLMRGMLLLYPICALMIAGGRLASKIILASGAAENNLFIILVAMVAEAGPLFLIPGLTRSAYRATGQLGATLNGFRGRLAGGARHMIAGNPAFHRAIDRNRFERIGNRNNRILSRYEESAKNLASGTGGLRDRFRARQTTGNLERITEARKMQVAAEQRQQEIAKWAGTATTDSTGREIRDVSGNLITQGQAIVNAQIANAQLNTEGEVARANLMNNVQYQDTRRTQTAKTISEETTKMYADSYSRMSVTQLQTALAGAVNAAPGSANQSEQISAAIRTFSSIGQMDKARDVLNANSAGMQAYATSNAENRNRLVQELGGSGDWIMREYSKHIAKQAEIPGGVVKDFSSWSNSADAAADSSLAASLRKRGVSALADLDKDSIEYVTNNANALNAVSADAFASAAANTTNGEIITKLSNAIERLDDAKRQTIVNNTSADQFVRMSDDIRSTLALGHRSAPGHRTDGRIRVVFNAQINDLRQPANSQIAARLSSQDRARFGV